MKFLSLQLGYVRAREGGALLGQENTELRAFEMARHWVADFWVVHHLGRAPMRLVRAQLNCAQMGNAVKDQSHSERRSVEPRFMVGRGRLGRRSFWLCATKGRPGAQARKKVALNRVQT